MARFTSGWIKAWRKAAESDLVDNMVVWGLWHWLLYAATWQPQKKIIDGKQRTLPAGTVLFSPKEISALWGCSESVIRKWLNYLHDTGRVVRESCGRGTLVTICNWDTYQGGQDQACADREDAVRAPCVPRADGECLNEEVKKGRKEEIEKCIEAWGRTLSRLEIKKDPRLDETLVAQLLLRHGFDKTALALLGAGFEESSKDYNPKKHVSIRRLLRPDVFEKFVNLGAQNQPIESEAVAWDLSKVGGA